MQSLKLSDNGLDRMWIPMHPMPEEYYLDVIPY